MHVFIIWLLNWSSSWERVCGIKFSATSTVKLNYLTCWEPNPWRWWVVRTFFKRLQLWLAVDFFNWCSVCCVHVLCVCLCVCVCVCVCVLLDGRSGWDETQHSGSRFLWQLYSSEFSVHPQNSSAQETKVSSLPHQRHFTGEVWDSQCWTASSQDFREWEGAGPGAGVKALFDFYQGNLNNPCDNSTCIIRYTKVPFSNLWCILHHFLAVGNVRCPFSISP